MLLILPNNLLRRAVVVLSSIVLCAASIYLLAEGLGAGTVKYAAEGEIAGQLMLLLEAVIALFIVFASLKYRNYVALLLILVQSAILLYFELSSPHIAVSNNLFIDEFSIIMALIVGIIGSLISVYALGYMRDFHEHHKEVKDHRSVFFFIIFVFLSAMFGLVFSNNIMWLYFFWEVTTLCSFILIGYTQTHEAVKNAFTALSMNLLGGIAFALAILFLGTLSEPVLELDKLVGLNKIVALTPVVLICFAGITKSAQIPFSSWLVGAMIAPTPVSALLHSSTMVKAGVYIIIRLAPVLEGSLSGFMVALVGAFTFLIASAIAISQSNAKKVLAYSTIANLGLVVACGGLGTYEAMWAGILLIVFHAISKSLLFLCVGTVEHRISSRDIEDMEGLVVRMPKMAIMILIGIAGMFLAPFGMLISKWAALKAFVDASPVISPILLAIIAYGSALTVFFWSKWMGKLITVTRLRKVVEDKISNTEWVALYSLAGLTVIVCLVFPVMSSVLIEPFVEGVYGMAGDATQKIVVLSEGNVTIMLIMLGLLLFMPFSMLYYGRDRKRLAAYMCGRPTTPDMIFEGSLGLKREFSFKNYYMDYYFGEGKMLRLGIPLCTLLLALMFGGVMSTGVLL
ncbi:MAG: NADH-quinone oxidoreductase subunit L [Candidatus Altiarchaeota archaeon]|nr:NADH-quinone oxidoreductase subunit L [Candidatus Altiarchaeota archaeon]